MSTFKSPLSNETSPVPPKSQNPLKIGKHQRKNRNKKEEKLLAKAEKLFRKQTAPIHINRRMRKENREVQIKALEGLTISDSVPQQENYSCNWKLLQKVLNNDNKGTKLSKRKFQNSTEELSVSSKKKKQRLSSESSIKEVDTTSKGSETTENISESDLNTKIIEKLSKRTTHKTKNGKPVAWFQKIDPLLLEDDIVMGDSDDNSAGESDIEGDAVEFDMDGLDKYVETTAKKESMILEKKMNENLKKRLAEPIAIDCEMVGVGLGGLESALARVSIVDKNCVVLYDKYVKPMEKVTDYRTKISGIRLENLEHATELKQIQLEVSNLLKDKLVVGHAVRHDFTALMLSHPAHYIRDTSTYLKLLSNKQHGTPSLKNLARDHLGINIQDGEHNSIEDAKVAMQLYESVKDGWEYFLSTSSRAALKKMNAKRTVLVRGTRKKKMVMKNAIGNPKTAGKKNKKNKNFKTKI